MTRRRKLKSHRRRRQPRIWKSTRFLHEYENVVILRDLLVWQEDVPQPRSAKELSMFYPNRYHVPRLNAALKRMASDGLLTRSRQDYYTVNQAIAGVYAGQRRELVA